MIQIVRGSDEVIQLRIVTSGIGPTASVAGIRTARKLSRGKLPSRRWSLTVEFDPLLTVVAGPTRKLWFALLIVTGSHGVDSAPIEPPERGKMKRVRPSFENLISN